MFGYNMYYDSDHCSGGILVRPSGFVRALYSLCVL